MPIFIAINEENSQYTVDLDLVGHAHTANVCLMYLRYVYVMTGGQGGFRSTEYSRFVFAIAC